MVEPSTPYLTRFTRFFACLGGIALLFWVLLPQLRNVSPTWDAMSTMIQERGIEVGMFFYTDVKLTGDADLHMRSALAPTRDKD